jgi:uncharacterized protein YceK
MKMKVFTLMAVSAICLTGCGTVFNLASKEPQPYGGLANDIKVVAAPHLPAGSASSAGALAMVLALGAGEFCASAVADTLTFPFILFYEARISRENTAKQADYSKLPVQYSAGAVAAPPPQAFIDHPALVEDKGWESK